MVGRTPSSSRTGHPRIRLIGFHSLVPREYRISVNSQLDFFIIDPVNKFVMENN
ncbi:hypothetical protein BN2476_110058 [Paraburkholderia piptadeniae]|uniref:Uncharacterized protein n=1 Tax=Paraburkholderia piptadeniae TaxID=1701573 RepID=A0A1N7RPN1_9BURK|nr:hypothetical protein [Paraburkholderia piptadeniae]SIT37009.1 hypothetical protein BN2476_110058 [Paraburkholderia piptadeniae]